MSQLSQSVDNESSIRSEDDMFQILLATDIHLGYAENDSVRGPDTFDSLEEILQIAVAEKVDFILLGGDLFHHAQPSPYCIYKCMELFKKYCLGDRPITIEFLSDAALNFSQTLNATVNYEDPNMNVGLPVFSIHGNHDDPTGQKHISALDLLSTSGLVNYFGRWNTFDRVDISPILLKKGKSKLALYGLSHIRDERLGRLFLDDKVKMLSPENADDWFHLLVWHQNRASRGTKNFIPDDTLPEFLDLVVWGHEHDCRIEAERKPNGVYISQPGSSVATSLTDGESNTKNVGILKIHDKDFQITPIELKSVRPFEYGEITLKDILKVDEDDEDGGVSPEEYSKQIVIAKIDRMIQEAKSMGRNPKVSEKPLIRLIVQYKNERQVFNTIRFGQAYVDKVANPDTMVKFQYINNNVRRKKVQDNGVEEQAEGPILADRVEDLVCEHFKENDSLSVFALNSINEAVKKFVDSNDGNAINDVAENFLKETLKQLGKDLPEITETEACILNFKNTMEKDSVEFVNNILNDPKRQRAKVVSTGNDSESKIDNADDSITIDDDDDGGGPSGGKTSTSTRGRGAGNGRATRAGSGRATRAGNGRATRAGNGRATKTRRQTMWSRPEK